MDVGVFLLNPTYLGLFEGFSAIMQQLKDKAVKGGYFKDHMGILKHLHITNED